MALTVKGLLLFAIICLILIGSMVLSVGSSAQSLSIGPLEHQNAPCTGCHPIIVSRDNNDAMSLPGNRDCLSCHRGKAGFEKTGNLVFHGDPSRNCTDCHSFHQTNRLSAKGSAFIFDYQNNGLIEHCRSCHKVDATITGFEFTHRIAQDTYHRDFNTLADANLSEPCLNCHRDGLDSKKDDLLSPAAPAIHSDLGHPQGDSPVFGPSAGGFSEKIPTDPKIKLFEGRIECQTCHDLTSDSDNLLSAADQPSDQCLSCHTRNKH